MPRIKKSAVAEVPIAISAPIKPKSGYEQLGDGDTLEALPASGRCTCGARPYDWNNSNRGPNVGYFCPHSMHGGNGRFWLWPGTTIDSAPVKRTRKRGGQSAPA